MNKKKNPVLAKSERLYLSSIEVLKPHSATLCKWFNDPQVYGLLRDMSQVTTPAIELAWLEQCIQDPKHEIFSIFYLPEDKLIGYGGFKDINAEDRSAEIWIVLGETDYWRRGLGQEGRWLLCQYGFDKLRYQNILGEHYAINAVSLHNALKTGSQKIGTRRQYKWMNGKFIDVHYTDMLREDLKKPAPK